MIRMVTIIIWENYDTNRIGDTKFSKKVFRQKCVPLLVGNPEENIEITRPQNRL